MAKGSFRCARCDRTFSMAAHLARHQSAVHGVGGRKKRSGRGPGRPPGKRGPGRPRGSGRSGAAPVAVGMGEGASRIVSEMSMYRDQLMSQRASIEAQLVTIDGAISAMGGGSSGLGGSFGGVSRIGRGPGRPRGTGRRGRPKGSGGRSGSLQPMMVQVLRQRGGAMTPQEIADAVIRAGYKTKSSSLVKAVSNALPKIREIKRVGRGQYSA